MSKAWNLIFFFIAFAGLGAEEACSGTLIVTYQTGVRAERLDRVRFLVKDTNHQQQMYPKGTSYVDDEYCFSRMVVIEDLPRGDYTIEFIVPNHDQLFEEVPTRKFSITQNEVIKIDQILNIRYGTIQAIAQADANAPAFNELPKVTIRDDSLLISPQTAELKLEGINLLPGTYTIIFHDLPGYTTPAPVQVQLAPDQKVGPVTGLYSKED